MHWLIINTEAFAVPEEMKAAVKGAKANKKSRGVVFDKTFLPKILLHFLSAFNYPFIILDESSKIKTNTPMEDKKKSARCLIIKTLNDTGERAIATGTVKSKSPLNLYDQYGFLDPAIFPETMFEMAERYQIMQTIRVGRGRRVLLSKSDYERIRKRLVNAYNRGGDVQLNASKSSIFRENTISDENLEWIMAHKEYSPFINQAELNGRIKHCTMHVRREDVFDITHERFVNDPIKRAVESTPEQVSLMHELITLGFTDHLTLGQAAALELMHRLQDVCNGFEPIEDKSGEKRVISYRQLKENPKLDALMDLLEEIDTDENQVAVFSARNNFTEAIIKELANRDISVAHYKGSNMEAAEAQFQSGEAKVFLSNLQPSAYGLNSLAKCKYAIYVCLDYKAEVYYQSKHRLLRGQLTEPKFAYNLYMANTMERRIIDSMQLGLDLINDISDKEIFMPVKE